MKLRVGDATHSCIALMIAKCVPLTIFPAVMTLSSVPPLRRTSRMAFSVRRMASGTLSLWTSIVVEFDSLLNPTHSVSSRLTKGSVGGKEGTYH